MDVDTVFSGPEVIGLVGAVLVGIATFVPWVKTAVDIGPVDFAVVSTGLQGIGILTLLLAVVAALVILTPAMGREGAVATGFVGLAVALVGLRGFLAIAGPASPGIGLYLIVAGGLTLVVGALLEYVARSESPAGAPQ